MNPPLRACVATWVPLAACEAEDTSPETREVEAAEEDLRWVVAVAREQRTLDETRTRAAAADAAAKHGRDTRPKLPDIDETRNTARRGCGCTRHKALQKENPDIFVFGVVSSRRCPLVMRSD